MGNLQCGWCGEWASEHTQEDWRSHAQANEIAERDEPLEALRKIAALDAVALRNSGFSVGDRAIAIARRALGDATVQPITDGKRWTIRQVRQWWHVVDALPARREYRMNSKSEAEWLAHDLNQWTA